VVECLFSVCKALGLTPRTTKKCFLNKIKSPSCVSILSMLFVLWFLSGEIICEPEIQIHGNTKYFPGLVQFKLLFQHHIYLQHLINI
jgi:hypothetical protein